MHIPILVRYGWYMDRRADCIIWMEHGSRTTVTVLIHTIITDWMHTKVRKSDTNKVFLKF